jgi:release factor glutamine methyltransferase
MRSETVDSRRHLLAQGASVLAAAGLGRSRSEALRLWTELTGESPDTALLADGRGPAPEHADAFASAISRRAAGEPLAYITGACGFRHLTLRADRRALIPRPETEGLVDLVLSRVADGRLADVGTGSGCIALSLATEGSYREVIAIDRSAGALELADENRRATGGRISLLRGDLCAALGPGSLDALVSNPPYLTEGEHAGLDPSVRDWEPAEALAAGLDGMEAIGRLLEDGRRVLRPGGWLAMEIDCARAGRCARRAGESAWTDIAIHADLFGRERYLLARRSDTP